MAVTLLCCGGLVAEVSLFSSSLDKTIDCPLESLDCFLDKTLHSWFRCKQRKLNTSFFVLGGKLFIFVNIYLNFFQGIVGFSGIAGPRGETGMQVNHEKNYLNVKFLDTDRSKS